jgi:uncharacterized protein (DUF427 family)
MVTKIEILMETDKMAVKTAVDPKKALRGVWQATGRRVRVIFNGETIAETHIRQV